MREIIKSKATTYPEIMAFIKEHKKLFLKEAKSHWGNRTIWAGASTTGWQMKIKQLYMNQEPRKGDDLIALGRAIQHWFEFETIKDDYQTLLKVLLKLHIRYAEKIEKRWLKMENKPNRVKDTVIIRDLFERGFIFISDFLEILENTHSYKTPFVIVSHNKVIIWPHIFEDKEIANLINEKRGMPYYTSVKSLESFKK